MKKRVISMAAMVAIIGVSAVAYANPKLPVTADSDTVLRYKINADLETFKEMGGSSDNIELVTIDHNPTCYQKVLSGGHVIESWTEDGIAYSKVDGHLTKKYKINGDIETVSTESIGDSDYSAQSVDMNPNCYTETNIAGHVVEGWIENGIAYSKEVK